ncbi:MULTISPECIES: hypothetical protein [Paraburkholderia]|uniref:hypothetical protein n=1 Tax=Paraburkholderia TaxID=1822464 RepID=UPI002253DC52|nr:MULTISPECIES: hypothetical protein [Paraburkholderia]MCX4154995.1 hypothetical protein [Paraburkholderia aspalathi]MDN7164405.1 hypothetical protein [Paraburkholderia sp. SECH2]MDQ6392890.1 hypothetical protein [Paraburkholderia aspalathi]
MATRRYSLNPETRIDQIIDAAGIATVAGQIEVTVDWTALVTTNGMSAAQAKMQVQQALNKVESYLESEIAKLNLPG